MYLAIDIGGTKTLLAVFDADGKITFEQKIITNKDFPKLLEDIRMTLDQGLKDREFAYCCCASPGRIDRENGIVLSAGNLKWSNIPLKKGLESLFGQTPILVENDAKLGALSEGLLVHDKYKKCLYLTLSTGIGGGVTIDGKIDSDFIGLEPGNMILEHDGKLQKWEDFASGRALKERYGKEASQIDDPKVWEEYSKILAPGIEQLLAVIQPDAVIIGGGVGTHFEKFAVPLQRDLKQLENPMVQIPPILKAQRPEEAVIYGCYDLIRQQI